jgi:hypothetical protein
VIAYAAGTARTNENTVLSTAVTTLLMRAGTTPSFAIAVT